MASILNIGPELQTPSTVEHETEPETETTTATHTSLAIEAAATPTTGAEVTSTSKTTTTTTSLTNTNTNTNTNTQAPGGTTSSNTLGIVGGSEQAIHECTGGGGDCEAAVKNNRIAVGVSVGGVVLIIAILIYLYRRRVRKRLERDRLLYDRGGLSKPTV